jgi:hypothetical protein
LSRISNKEARVGSFSEVVLFFNFRKDTPDAVLATFSALAVPNAHAPQLPPPVIEPDKSWHPLNNDPENPSLPEDADPYEAEPWRHDWAQWLSSAMGAQTSPSAALAWTGGRWNFACRSSFKYEAESTFSIIAWLGPFIDDLWGDPDDKQLIGHIYYDGAPRPYLLWCQNGQLTMEDLNPDDSWQY